MFGFFLTYSQSVRAKKKKEEKQSENHEHRFCEASFGRRGLEEAEEKSAKGPALAVRLRTAQILCTAPNSTRNLTTSQYFSRFLLEISRIDFAIFAQIHGFSNRFW